MIRVVDLFSGAGGLTLGFKNKILNDTFVKSDDLYLPEGSPSNPLINSGNRYLSSESPKTSSPSLLTTMTEGVPELPRK